MKGAFEIKLNKRFVINVLLAIALIAILLETAELGLLAYALKTGTFCK